jgi:hypothetical protein
MAMGTKLPSEAYLPIWEAAEAEEIGLEIKVVPEDQMLLVQALYDCKKAVGGFEDFIIAQPKPPGTIFLVRKTVEMD